MADDTSNRGFAAMSDEQQQQIASEGGKTTAGKNLSKEARAKGGKRSHGGGRKSNS
jgi:general stress protein YciG